MKVKVYLYLFLFVSNVIISLTWIILQFVYVRETDANENLSLSANVVHLIAILSAVCLGCFIAFVVV